MEHLVRFGKQRLLMTSYLTPDVEHEENWFKPTFRTSVCHIKSSMKKHGFLGINTGHCLVCLRSQLKKLA